MRVCEDVVIKQEEMIPDHVYILQGKDMSRGSSVCIHPPALELTAFFCKIFLIFFDKPPSATRVT